MKRGDPDDGAGIGLGSAITLLIKVSFLFFSSVVARSVWRSLMGRIRKPGMDSSRKAPPAKYRNDHG
jgi:hypothetical protein